MIFIGHRFRTEKARIAGSFLIEHHDVGFHPPPACADKLMTYNGWPIFVPTGELFSCAAFAYTPQRAGEKRE
jgi:hypothetical protein